MKGIGIIANQKELKFILSLLKKPIVFILILSLMACLDRFIPDFEGDENLSQLSVEAALNNSDDRFEIKLSKSIAVGTDASENPINDARVILIRESDERDFEFVIIGPGTYTYSNNLLKPQVGERYKLRIILENDKTFESTYEEVLPAVPLRDLEYENVISSYIVSGRLVDGETLQISETIAKGNEDNYFRYDYGGIYAFRAPYQGNPLFCNEEIIDDGSEPVEDLVCYLPQTKRLPINIYSNETMIANTSKKEAVITILPLREFALGYLMDVYKHRINKDYFDYLAGIKAQVELSGSLFDAPPSQLIGNISDIDNPDNKALGYFTFETTSTETIFIDRNFFTSTFDPNNINLCPFDPMLPEFKADPWCCDCSLRTGATTERPENWRDP